MVANCPLGKTARVSTSIISKFFMEFYKERKQENQIKNKKKEDMNAIHQFFV